MASDTIYREILRVKAAGKPVVVSMGNVAASGGYYISAPATKIVAQPSTVTGSIGVVSTAQADHRADKKFLFCSNLQRLNICTSPHWLGVGNLNIEDLWNFQTYVHEIIIVDLSLLCRFLGSSTLRKHCNSMASTRAPLLRAEMQTRNFPFQTGIRSS